MGLACLQNVTWIRTLHLRRLKCSNPASMSSLTHSAYVCTWVYKVWGCSQDASQKTALNGRFKCQDEARPHIRTDTRTNTYTDRRMQRHSEGSLRQRGLPDSLVNTSAQKQQKCQHHGHFSAQDSYISMELSTIIHQYGAQHHMYKAVWSLSTANVDEGSEFWIWSRVRNKGYWRAVGI